MTSSGDYSAVLQMVSKLQEQLKLVQSEVAGKPETLQRKPKPAALTEPAHVSEDDAGDNAWDDGDEEGTGEVEEPQKRPSLSPSEEEACAAAYWAGEEEDENEQEEGGEDWEEWDEKEEESEEKEGEENEEKEGEENEEEDADEGEDRQLEQHEKKQKGVTLTVPVATPARAALALPDLKRLASSSSLNAPPTEATVPDESVAAPAAPVINSTTHKREYMRLDSWIN